MAGNGWGQFITDWYRKPSHNANDYFLHQFVKNIPFIGGILEADDNQRRMDDYLKNRGLSYEDIRYNGAPFGRTLGQATANTTTSVMNLYRNEYKDMMKGRESARKEKWKQYVQREMLKHRQVQSVWYRNHMRRYRSVSSQAHRGGRSPPCEALSLLAGQQLPQPP